MSGPLLAGSWQRDNAKASNRLQRLTNIDEAAVVLITLRGAAGGLLGLLLLGDLGGLAAHLTGTGEGTVDLACEGERRRGGIRSLIPTVCRSSGALAGCLLVPRRGQTLNTWCPMMADFERG